MNRRLLVLLFLFCSLSSFAQRIQVFSEELDRCVYSTSSFEVSYSCNDCPPGIHVNVYVDHKLQKQLKDKGLISRNQRFHISGLPLRQGSTNVRLEFLDAHENVIEEMKYTLQYRSNAKRLSFLGIGVGGILDDPSFGVLHWPSNDVQKVSRFVSSHMSPYYELKTVANRNRPDEVTKAGVDTALQELENGLAADGKDVVFLYLSGHGAIGDDNEWYFITQDARNSDLPTTAYGGDRLRAHIRKMAQSAQVYVFVDACYAGALFPDPGALPSNVVVFASSQDKEVSYEGDEETQSSFFSKAFCEAFSGKLARNNAGEITVKGFFNYINAVVEGETWHRQHPLLLPQGKYEEVVLFKVDESADQGAVTPSPAPVRGAVPALLSIVPGGGQLYKQDYLKSALFLGGTLVGSGGIVFCESQRKAYLSQADQTHDINALRQASARAQNMEIARNICIGATAILYVYNIADAAFAPGHKRVQVTPSGIRVQF
jgi:hypothetical protein